MNFNKEVRLYRKKCYDIKNKKEDKIMSNDTVSEFAKCVMENNEKLIYRETQSPIPLIASLITLILSYLTLSLFSYFIYPIGVLFKIIMILPLVFAIMRLVEFHKNEIIITNIRVANSAGFNQLSLVNDRLGTLPPKVEQSFLGRKFNYGKLTFKSYGMHNISGKFENISVYGIKKPLEFKQEYIRIRKELFKNLKKESLIEKRKRDILDKFKEEIKEKEYMNVENIISYSILEPHISEKIKRTIIEEGEENIVEINDLIMIRYRKREGEEVGLKKIYDTDFNLILER